jgi:ABC-type protease/lipase transport system fused ATPase/permease subunit
MIKCNASSTTQRLAQGFPVVAIIDPRQSGKTTLARAVCRQALRYAGNIQH